MLAVPASPVLGGCDAPVAGHWLPSHHNAGRLRYARYGAQAFRATESAASAPPAQKGQRRPS